MTATALINCEVVVALFLGELDPEEAVEMSEYLELVYFGEADYFGGDTAAPYTVDEEIIACAARR